LEPLKHTHQIESSNHSPDVVIIDGLDECQDGDIQSRILSIIRSAVEDNIPFRFLITCRPEPDIRDVFHDGDLGRISQRLALDIDCSRDEDIAIFLRERFGEIRRKHRRNQSMATVAQPWPSEETIQTLVRKASGQFIYASTVLRFIDVRHELPTERLDIILGILTAGDRTPFAELDQLYTGILSLVPDIRRTLRVLGVILAFQERPHPLVIEQLLSLRPGDVDLLLCNLHSLLHIPDPLNNSETGSDIHVLHASLSDFLMDCDRSGHFSVNSCEIHADLAQCCLGFIMQKESSTSRLSCKFNTCVIWPQVTILVSTALRPTSYAMHHWIYHSLRSGGGEALINDIQGFDIKRWIESSTNVWPHSSYKLLDSLPTMITWLRHQVAFSHVPGLN